mmetsp:Transcript_27666/g.27356  ORF Transcript_27666/g.27356 Transcript_27666/m.27356 type:complete len:219 (-) Transcript_27666:29-685(-)
MPNLEVLSLSVNKITTLKHFQYCRKLTELYLRKNLISDLNEIRYLQDLPSLKVLWLWDNPCAELSNYRAIVIGALPNLVKLDNQAVTPEEKSSAPSAKHSKPRYEEPNRPEPRREEARSREEARREEPRREEPRREEYRREEPKEYRREEAKYEEPQRRELSPISNEQPRAVRNRNGNRGADSRNENILCAVLSLIKELDKSGLELVQRDIERKLAGM